MSDGSPSLGDGESYEKTHVHSVYEQIASHFSQTRYKPWPLISNFLLSLPPGSVGLDIGCGNGKYLNINPTIYIVGSDRSQELVNIARGERCVSRPSDAVVGDALDLPHAVDCFDFIISIAVVHHMSTSERRVEATRSVLETLRPNQPNVGGGKALIYVWALEQKNSRRGWDKGDEQDVMVPWIMKGKDIGGEDTTFKRYYHLYRQGELEEDIERAGGTVVQHGYERDNWWAIATRQDPISMG